MLNIDLNGKVALVTGGGQGLGEAIARRLHEAGAAIIVNYFADRDGANKAKADAVVASLGARAMACEADVRDADAVGRMAEAAVAGFGGVDVLVNSAGIIRDRTLRKMTAEDWAAVIDTNLTGVFNVCKACADRLNDGGRVVNIASISAFQGFFGQANYAAAKAGLIGFTKVLSRELARRAITVNAIAPGVVLTEMGLSIPETVRAEMLKSIPLGRFGEQREIADVVLFLCSDMASYMTGQTLHINGGWM